MFDRDAGAFIDARLRARHLAQVRLHHERPRVPPWFKVALDVVQVDRFVERSEKSLGIVRAETPAKEIADGALCRARKRAAAGRTGGVPVAAAAAVAVDLFGEKRIGHGIVQRIPQFVELNVRHMVILFRSGSCRRYRILPFNATTAMAPPADQARADARGQSFRFRDQLQLIVTDGDLLSDIGRLHTDGVPRQTLRQFAPTLRHRFHCVLQRQRAALDGGLDDLLHSRHPRPRSRPISRSCAMRSWAASSPAYSAMKRLSRW